MKYAVIRFWRNLRSYLSSQNFHEFLIFLFFLALSAVFWLMQTVNESFQARVIVPLQLEGVPENVKITTELPPSVTISIRDRGTNLIRFLRRRELNPVHLQFNTYDNGLVSSRIQISKIDIQHLVEEQLPGSSQIVEIRPDTLEFYFNRGLHRRLPVRIRGSITTSPQNYLSRISCDPDSVDVYASNAALDTMTAAYTQAVSMTDLTQSATQKARFISRGGVLYEPARVTIRAQVDYFTEKSVVVPITGLNFPADRQLKTFPSQATITFRVGSSQYNKFNEDSFVLAPTYEELLQNESDKLRLHLRSIPEGVSNVRIDPAEVDYLIEQIDNKEEGE